MGDYDRDREPPRDTERTTIITSDGDRRGGSGLMIVVVVIIAVLVLLFVLFGGGFNRAADEVGINVNVDTPVPDINVKIPEKIEVNLPEVDVQTKDSNKQ